MVSLRTTNTSRKRYAFLRLYFIKRIKETSKEYTIQRRKATLNSKRHKANAHVNPRETHVKEDNIQYKDSKELDKRQHCNRLMGKQLDVKSDFNIAKAFVVEPMSFIIFSPNFKTFPFERFFSLSFFNG